MNPDELVKLEYPDAKIEVGIETEEDIFPDEDPNPAYKFRVVSPERNFGWASLPSKAWAKAYQETQGKPWRVR